MLSLCGAPPQRLRKAPHDSSVCWKQLMLLLEEVLVCGGVSFPLHVPGRRRDSHPCDGYCAARHNVWRCGKQMCGTTLTDSRE